MKLLFDENLGLPLVNALRGLADFHRPAVEVKHAIELRHGGRPDAEWVPQVASGGWLVISADRGRRGPGAKLPQLCRAYGISHVLLAGRLHNSPQFDKACAILAVWPGLREAAQDPVGARYVLRYNTDLRPVLIRHSLA